MTRFLMPAVVAVLALLVAACGDRDTSAQTATTPAPPSTTPTGAAGDQYMPGPGGQAPGGERLAEVRACLERQGVELPDPSSGPPAGGLDEQLRAALQKCLPEGVAPIPGADPAN